MYSTLSSAPDSAAAATALASRSPTVVRRNSASILATRCQLEPSGASLAELWPFDGFAGIMIRSWIAMTMLRLTARAHCCTHRIGSKNSAASTRLPAHTHEHEHEYLRPGPGMATCRGAGVVAEQGFTERAHTPHAGSGRASQRRRAEPDDDVAVGALGRVRPEPLLRALPRRRRAGLVQRLAAGCGHVHCVLVQ